jgi:hypothetical protein
MPIGMADMEYGDISDCFMIKPSKHKETILRIGTALRDFSAGKFYVRQEFGVNLNLKLI